MIWVDREDGWMVPLDRADDAETWLKIVNDDDAVITQVDDGELYDGKGIFPTSSSSSLWLMAQMFDLLDVKEGMDVLEIGTGTGTGTGTGYNAALLAEMTRTGKVTTIEVDPAIAEHARQALGKTGYPVTVVTGDGTLGHVEHVPYSRVVATAAATAVFRPRPVARRTLVTINGRRPRHECPPAVPASTTDPGGRARKHAFPPSARGQAHSRHDQRSATTP